MSAGEFLEAVDRLAQLLGLEDALDGALDQAAAGDRLAEGFMVSAAAQRHLLADQLLPAELLPGDWPGPRLRARYERFDAAYKARLREHTRA
jgi:phenylacetic acid degradation operon negative regulatory protein